MTNDDWARYRRRNTGLAFTIAIMSFVIAIVGPWEVLAIWGMATGLWMVWGAWSIWPGPCAVCETRAVPRMPIPRNMELPMRPWWDLGFDRRSAVIWVCVEHVNAYLLTRVQQEIMRRKLCDGRATTPEER